MPGLWVIQIQVQAMWLTLATRMAAYYSLSSLYGSSSMGSGFAFWDALMLEDFPNFRSLCKNTKFKSRNEYLGEKNSMAFLYLPIA